jgi:hypothetical protein
LLLGAAVYYFFIRRPDPELPASVQYQLAVLDRTAEGLRGLSAFVTEHRRTLEQQELVVQRLRAEQDEIGPALEANGQTINAVLAAESRRQQERVWLSRFEGFASGVISSLFASLLWTWVARRREPGDAWC